MKLVEPWNETSVSHPMRSLTWRAADSAVVAFAAAADA
jgi:hypothetical protein